VPKKKKRIVLIDGDILVYRTSAACEERTIEVTHKKSSRKKIFKTRTEFKTFLKEKEFDYVAADYDIKDIQTVNENVSYQFLIDTQLKNIKETLWGDSCIVYVAGKNNFRDKLPLPEKYKGQRDTSLKPLLRNDCKEYLIGKHKAIKVNGEEVDDRVIWVGYEYLNKGYEVIIVTSDKDSNAYSGLKIYNYTQENPEVVEIPKLGSLWLNDKGDVKGNGFLWYCLQLMVGDLIDNLKPTALCKIKYGAKSAYTLLKDCVNEQEALQLCIANYIKWYPKITAYTDCHGVERKASWKDIIDMYHKGIRMRETKDDTLDFKDFAKKYSIDLDDYNDETPD
jgi:5'-3' exonuclease